MLMDELLESGFEEMHIPCDGAAMDRLKTYFEFLEEKNSVMNLTAISGERDVAQLHFLDCAALLNEADFDNKRVIDVGTGAGFPGLVLKILKPDIRLTLLDSLDKRIIFLREMCEKLGFDDVECIHSRAEEAPKAYRESFDIATSRAVARLNVLCELCLPLVRPDGAFITMKGPDCTPEVKGAYRAIHELSAKHERTAVYTIPGTEVSHAAVIIKKTGASLAKYPRRWAQIKAKPLA